MPPVKNVGKPCAGEPHARFDGRELETEPTSRDGHGEEQPHGKPRGHQWLRALKPINAPRQLPTLLLRVVTCGDVWLEAPCWTWGSRLSIMWFVRTTESQAAAAVRIGARLAGRKQAELLERLRWCFRRIEPFVQARKYVR